MKKTALAILLALGVTSVASAKIFVQADIGYGALSVDYMNIDNSNRFVWRPTIGMEYNHHLFGLDYTNWLNKDRNYLDNNNSLKFYTIGLKYAYRLGLEDTLIRPYLGARLNLSSVKYNHWSPSSYNNEDDMKFGVGVFGGIEFPLTSFFTLGVNAEANWLSSDLRAYELGAFARFSF